MHYVIPHVILMTEQRILHHEHEVKSRHFLVLVIGHAGWNSVCHLCSEVRTQIAVLVFYYHFNVSVLVWCPLEVADVLTITSCFQDF